jgi:hypothetical protein
MSTNNWAALTVIRINVPSSVTSALNLLVLVYPLHVSVHRASYKGTSASAWNSYCIIDRPPNTNYQHTRAIRKATSNECQQNKAMKILIIYENTYILKLLLNVVTPGIEVIIVSRNRFLYACVKQFCRLRAQTHFDTCWKAFILISSSSW